MIVLCSGPRAPHCEASLHPTCPGARALTDVDAGCRSYRPTQAIRHRQSAERSGVVTSSGCCFSRKALNRASVTSNVDFAGVCLSEGSIEGLCRKLCGPVCRCFAAWASKQPDETWISAAKVLAEEADRDVIVIKYVKMLQDDEESANPTDFERERLKQKREDIAQLVRAGIPLLQ
jgi:hypothetical protein